MDDFKESKTDEQLAVERIEEAYQELYKRWVSRLIAMARRWGCGDDSEDLANETLIKVFTVQSYFYDPNRKDTSENSYAFGSWLYRVHTFTLIAWYRKNGSQVNDPIELYENAKEFGQYDRPTHLLEYFLPLRQCLEILNEKDRIVINLKQVEGYTFPQIGGLLNEPKSTVQTRHDRALDKLRSCLESKGFTGAF